VNHNATSVYRIDVPTNAAVTPQVYGIDLSSVVSVLALNPCKGDDVLDLCCAPGLSSLTKSACDNIILAEVLTFVIYARRLGAKLCFIADCLVDPDDGKVHGTVTGVDIRRDRLEVCRGLVRAAVFSRTLTQT